MASSVSKSGFFGKKHASFLSLHAIMLFITMYFERETLSTVIAGMPCCFNEKLKYFFDWFVTTGDKTSCYSKYLIINFALMIAVIFVTKTETKRDDNVLQPLPPPVVAAASSSAAKKEGSGDDKKEKMSLLSRISKNFNTLSSVIYPVSALIAYMSLIYSMMASLWRDSIESSDADKSTFEGHNSFKEVWFAGPAYGTIIYLSCVYFGKKFMKDRDAFNITSFVFLYNLYQCVMNLACVIAVIYILFTNPHFRGLDLGDGFYLPKIWGNRSEKGLGGVSIAMVVWVHYNNKYLELLDTLWMVLKKKNDQISFLHVYHHVLLIWAWWYCCRVGLGGDCYFGATVNSFIHIIMYAYYTGALLKYELKTIKKNITNCQMLQFACCLFHSIYVVINGNVPIGLPLAQGFVMVNMLYLFEEFRRVAYAEKQAIERSKSQQALLLAQQQSQQQLKKN